MDAKQRLLIEIVAEVRETARYTGRAALNPRVMAAMAAAPREAFVPPVYAEEAYVNAPLPIGCGQTISQPYIVALMTDLLDADADDTVLEVGCGSGYQAAVLARLVKYVYSMEIVEVLADQARERLRRLGCANVEVRCGDGYSGWPAHAPFDAIIVTAAAPWIPPALIEQLKPGGRLVIPIGQPFSAQELVVVEKDADGAIRQRSVLPVAFVPLVGGHPEEA